MGYLRLFLAHLVLLSHLGVRFWGLNEGVVAVTVFYLLAGHVVARVFLKVFKGSLPLFYLERVLRVYPLYLFFATLTLIFLLFTGFGSPKVTLEKLVYNYLLVPLNYYMFIPEKITVLKDSVGSWWLVPPAWSLGAEVQAYLLLPLLLLSRFFFWFSFLFSFFIYALANVGVLHSDYFGYRLLCGVLFFFLTGSLIEKRSKILFLLYLLFLFYGWLMIFHFKTWGAYTRETLLGLTIGVPTVYLLVELKKRVRLKGEKLGGNLSYGVFLSHFLAIWFLEYLGVEKGMFFNLYVVTLSNILALIGVFLVDLPVERVRFSLGKKRSS